MPPDDFFDRGADSSPVPQSWEHLVQPVPASWFTDTPPSQKWLLRDSRREKRDGVFPAGKVGALIGPGGISKTYAAIDLAIAVATGGRWLDTFEAAPAGKVLLLLGEEDEEEAWRRFYNVGHGRHSLPGEGSIVRMCLAGQPVVRLRDRDSSGVMFETAFLVWLRGYLTTTAPWALVYLDPLARFSSPDAEKDNDEATRLVQVLEGLAACARGSLLFSHHTPKLVTGRGGRGVTAIHDACRWEATLESQENKLADREAQERLARTVTLSNTKSNYSRPFNQVLLRRREGGPLVTLDDVDRELVGQGKDATSRFAVARRDQLARDDEEARKLWAERPGSSQRLSLKPELHEAPRVRGHASSRRHCLQDEAGCVIAAFFPLYPEAYLANLTEFSRRTRCPGLRDLTVRLSRTPVHERSHGDRTVPASLQDTGLPGGSHPRHDFRPDLGSRAQASRLRTGKSACSHFWPVQQLRRASFRPVGHSA